MDLPVFHDLHRRPHDIHRQAPCRTHKAAQSRLLLRHQGPQDLQGNPLPGAILADYKQKHPVTQKVAGCFFKFVLQTLKVLSLGTAHTSERACELYKTFHLNLREQSILSGLSRASVIVRTRENLDAKDFLFLCICVEDCRCLSWIVIFFKHCDKSVFMDF